MANDKGADGKDAGSAGNYQCVCCQCSLLAVLFILTRLGGKRQIAQMNLFDYVNSITIGSIAAEMATNLEQWYRPLTAMIVYGIAAFAVHYGTCKNRNVRLWLSGQAIPLMENGTIYKAELDRAKIDLNEFLAQARVAGYFDLNEVQCAMLETSGQISFFTQKFQPPGHPAGPCHPDRSGQQVV